MDIYHQIALDIDVEKPKHLNLMGKKEDFKLAEGKTGTTKVLM